VTPLTEHFSQEEFGVLGCEFRLVNSALLLAQQIAEPIRKHFGRPMRVHCGYRDELHNARVGGKPDSWHLFEGTKSAFDFSIPGIDTESVFTWLRMASGLPFDKAILERNRSGEAACIHVQFDAARVPRRLAYVGSVGAAFDYQPMEVA
jgi:hypothetical protein